MKPVLRHAAGMVILLCWLAGCEDRQPPPSPPATPLPTPTPMPVPEVTPVPTPEATPEPTPSEDVRALMWLRDNPQFLPAQVALVETREFPIVIDGREVGRTTLHAGATGKPEAFDGETLTAVFAAAPRRVPVASTDLGRRALASYRAAAASPSTPAPEVVAETPAPPAPATVRSDAVPEHPNDNKTQPFLSVYRWDVSGLKKGEHDAFAEWLNRTSVWPQSHQPKDTWTQVRGEKWQLEPWSKWMAANPGNRFTLSVTILPGGWDRKGPKEGIDAGVPVSFEKGAAGEYNEHFRVLAENLVKYNLGDAILRPGWEFNGGWMPWRVTNAKEAEQFAEYWRQIVRTMRAVPGAENLHFCWNPNIGHQAYPPDKSWPGDEYVDSIGLDIYDDGYIPDTYPFPEGASEQEIERRRKKVWEHHRDSEYGLRWWSRFARKHGKPLAIPEWGTNIKKDGHGGGDNVLWIEGMHEFITDPANNVLFHCYFDVDAPDGKHQLSPGADGEFQTSFPKAAARFKELFGLPEKPSE